MLSSMIFLGPFRVLSVLGWMVGVAAMMTWLWRFKLPPTDDKMAKEEALIDISDGEVVCYCKTCRSTGALSIDIRNCSLCSLWFKTFEELLAMIEDTKKHDSRSKVT